MAISYDEYVKKKKKNQNTTANITNLGTSSNQKKVDYSKEDTNKLINDYVALRDKNKNTTINKPKISTAKDEDKKWYQQIFSLGEFDEKVDGVGDFATKTAKTILGTVTDLTQDVSKGFMKPIENVVDIGTNIVASGVGLFNDKTADKIRDFADRDLSERASNLVANVLPTGALYNVVSGKPENILDPDANYFEESSLGGYYADKTTELVGYTLGLIFGGKTLGKTGTVSKGVTTKAGTTALGGSLNAGNVGVTVAGRTLNIPTLAFAGGMASGLEESNSKENVTEAERWTKALMGGGIEGVTEGITGMFGVGGVTNQAGKEIFDVLGEKAAKLFTSKAGKILASAGIKSTGEVAEEFLSYTLNYFADNGIVDKLGEADFSSKYDLGEVGEQMALAFASSMIVQGGGTVIETNGAIKEAEQQLKRKLTNEEKAIVTQASIEGTLEEKVGNLQVQVEEQELEREEKQQDPIVEEQVQQEQVEEIAPTTNTVIPPTVQQELTNITNQIDELETMLDTNLTATQQQEILSQIQALNQKYNELVQQGQTQTNNNEIGPVQKANTKQISNTTTQQVESNSLTEVESNTQEIPKELKTYYHGTRGNFEAFDNSKIGQNYDNDWSSLGKGFYFTDNYESAKEYGASSINDGEVNVKEATLDIKNPFYVDEFTKNDKKVLDEIKTKYNLVDNDLVNGYRLIDALKRNGYDSTEVLKEYGFDGIIADDEVMVFDANQIHLNKKTSSENKKNDTKDDTKNDTKDGTKNDTKSDNEAKRKTPTQEELDNLEDIRKNKSGSEYASAYYDLEKKYGTGLFKGLNSYKSTGKAVEEELAPVKESIEDLTDTIKETNKAVKNLAKELKEVKKIAQEGKPLTLEELEDFYKQTDAEFRMVEEDVAPPPIQEDTTPDYEYENDNEGSISRVESPLIAEGRDMENVGSRKVKAYQYENPEVMPFFQDMAKQMQYDLQNSIKGERIINADVLYETNGEAGIIATKRHTTPDIADLLDNYNYTYADINKGLEAIIKDHGAENIAVAKRIEFALDERLRNGYTAIDGLEIPPNQEYIDLLKEKNWTDYSNSIPNNNIDEFDIFRNLEYNKDGIFISDANEYGSLQDTVKYLQSQNIIKKKGISYLENGNYWYAIKSNKFADFKTIAKIRIDGNEYLIDYMEREFKNGGNQNSKTVDSVIKSIELENGTSNRINANFTETTPTTRNDRLYNQEQRYSNGRYDNGTNDGNYGQELENSSFFNDDFAPLGNQSLAIEQAPTEDFDNGGPMIRVSPEMQKRTLNKPTETKNVDWEALEDTSKGEQQALVKKKLGETLEQRDVDWDSLDDTSRAKQKQYNTETGQIEDAIEKKTKKEIKEKLLRETGILNANLDEANKIPKALMENTDPIRLQEMIFGRGLGNQINDMFFQKVKDNTSEKIRFQNKERAEIKDLGIKARSKESAAVQKYGEKQWVNEYGELVPYGDKELAIDFPDVEVQNKIKKASQIIRQKYDNYLDETNKVLTELGYDAIPKREDYMRHFQELNDIFSRVGIPYNYNEMTANDLPTDINGLTHDFSPSKNFFANALRRTGNKTTYDAITGIDGYLEGIGNLIYHTEDIQRLRAYEQYIRDTYGENHGFDNLENLSDEQKTERIEKIQDNHLSNYASWLHEYTNTLAGKKSLVDRGIEHILGRRIYSFLNTTKSQVGKNMIGFNIGSAMTNAIAGVQTLAKTNKLAAVKGLSDTVKNIFRNDGFVNKNNFLTSRFGSESISKNWWQKVGDAGFIFMQGMDNFVSNFVVRSKYNELKSKGFSDEQAHIEAGKYASRLMSDRSQGAMPNLYNSQMLGIVTQFQNEVNNQLYSMFYDTYHESKESAQGNALKTTAGMVFTLGQMAVFTHIFGQAFEKMAGYNPTFDIIDILMKAFGLDDDEDSEDTLGDNLEQAFKQLGNALPYISILTGGGRIPISEALPINELVSGKDEYGNDKSRWKTLKETLPYYVLPTGYSQIKKTTQGLGMYDEDLPIAGSYTDSGNLRFTADESTWGKVQAGIFGRWANDEAQAYVDSEFKTIKKENIDELLDLGMKSSDYRKLKEKINKSGDSYAEKVDYIATLNELTNSQKNTLVNNILDRDYDVDVSNYEDYGSYDEFDAFYKNPETYHLGKAIAGNYTTYKEYKDYIWDLKADKDENGDSINGTRKTKVINYVNGLELSIPQKAMLIRKEYSSFDDYNNEIVEYVSNLDMGYEDKKTILEDLDFTIDENGYVHWE